MFSNLFTFFVFILGLVLLIKGADWLIDGAVSIAYRQNVSPVVIGLTIVAIGTSLPEFMVSLFAVVRKTSIIAVGNVVGSNIANIALVLGVASFIKPIFIKTRNISNEIFFLNAVTILFFGLAIKNGFSLTDGLIFAILFSFFYFYLFKTKSVPSEFNEEFQKIKKSKVIHSVVLSLTFIAIGITLLIIGARFTVNSAVKIAKMIGVSNKVIALSMVAFGTSLPELVTSVTAVLKKEPEVAVGNVIGSNVFNILFCIGGISLFKKITFDFGNILIDLLVMIFLTLLLLPFLIKKFKLKIFGGLVLILIYSTYIVFIYTTG